MSDLRIIEGDCLEVMAGMPSSSIDLIVTDPPYHRMKDHGWDRQWKTDAAHLRWLARVRDQWHRLLRPNGSLYCFASPRMAAQVEVLIGGRFEVLNSIVWAKHDGNGNGMHSRQDKSECRSWFPQTERIIFAEHYGADNVAKGEAGYAAKCDELRGFVFEPLRAYLDGERVRAGIGFEAVRAMVGCAAGSGLPSHWFTRSQWMLPTEANYLKLREGFNRSGGSYLRREYEELRREYEELRREYEELRREYEELRRPFSVTADVPYTDVWTFPTVSHRKGKHPCEKPLAMVEHMVRASSRPGAVVLDPFAGSGVTGETCRRLGRSCVLVEKDPAYAEAIRRRFGEPPLFAPVCPDANAGGR